MRQRVSGQFFVEGLLSCTVCGERGTVSYTHLDVYKRQPYMFASGPVIGVKPSQEYQFRLFGTPVGPYFKGGAKPLTLCVSDFDRAAPNDEK